MFFSLTTSVCFSLRNMSWEVCQEVVLWFIKVSDPWGWMSQHTLLPTLLAFPVKTPKILCALILDQQREPFWFPNTASLNRLQDIKMKLCNINSTLWPDNQDGNRIIVEVGIILRKLLTKLEAEKHPHNQPNSHIINGINVCECSTGHNDSFITAICQSPE